MKEAILDYKRIFDFYELPWKKAYSQADKRALRRTLSRIFENKYEENITWDDLTEERKILFITSEDVKNYLFGKHKGNKRVWIDESKQPKIEKKINDELRTNLVQALKIVDEHNEYIDALFEPAKDTSQTSFKNLCKTLKSYSSKIPLPTYEEFYEHMELSSSQESPIHPVRPYDYVRSWEQEYREKYPLIKNPVPQSEIDRICLDIILQVLEENFQLKIDTDKIDETLGFLSSHSKCADLLYELESFPETFEESLSNLGFEKYIEEHGEYFNAKDFNTLIRKFDERADSNAKSNEKSYNSRGITHISLDGTIAEHKGEPNNFKKFFEEYREKLSKNQSSPETKLDAYLASPNEDTFQKFEKEYNDYIEILKEEYEQNRKDFAIYLKCYRWRNELKPFYTMPKVSDIFQTVSGQKKIRK